MGQFYSDPDLVAYIRSLEQRINATERQTQQAPRSICQVAISADFAVSADEYVPWTSAPVDTDRMWSLSDPTKIRVPYDGVWLVNSNTIWQTNSTAHRVSRNELNAAVLNIGETVIAAAVAAQTTYTTTGAKRLIAGDYVRLRCLQSSGGSLNVRPGTTLTFAYLGVG